jgi:hypothetical protein
MQEAKIQQKDLGDDMVLVPGWDVFFSLPKHKKGTTNHEPLHWEAISNSMLRLLWRRHLHSKFEVRPNKS